MAQLAFNFLDIGQGDGTFIVFPDGSTMLVDLGSLKNSKIIKPEYVKYFDNYWQQGGTNLLDMLVITHGDQDHYNLIDDLFTHYDLDVTEIYVTGEIDDYSVGGFNTGFMKTWKKRLNFFADNASTGKSAWATIDGVKIYLLQANYPSIDATDPNDKSAVLLFEYAGNKMVMGGDATRKTEKEIVRYYTDVLKDPGFLQCDYMKVNHHGSETSSCEKWIKAVNPRYAFISADMHDGYLLPRCPVIQRILDDGDIDTKAAQHPYVCYDRSRDDWDNNKNTNAIYNTLAEYTKTAVYAKAKTGQKRKMVDEVVTGHGVRYSLIFKDTGKVTLEHTGFPTLVLSDPDSGRHGL